MMNSFGNRNFTQPMGRLSMHSKCLFFFFLLSFGLGGWGGGGGLGVRDDFFPLFLCSQHVPFKFPVGSHLGSQYVP